MNFTQIGCEWLNSNVDAVGKLSLKYLFEINADFREKFDLSETPDFTGGVE